MTKRLEQALAFASRLPDAEQDALADWLLTEIQDEQRWAEAFRSSQTRLADLADEALAADARGETDDLDPDRL